LWKAPRFWAKGKKVTIQENGGSHDGVTARRLGENILKNNVAKGLYALTVRGGLPHETRES